MKIALFGPSGTGKTTAAKMIAERYGLQYIPGSSYSKLLTDVQKSRLKELGYTGKGHREVIRLSLENPTFGRLFQDMVLENRTEVLQLNDNFVTDRSPVDNLVYFLLQNASQLDSHETNQFGRQCLLAFTELTHAIQLTTRGMEEVEDNQSRVNNIFYQRMVSAVFDHVTKEYFSRFESVRMFRVDTRELPIRMREIYEFLDYNHGKTSR